MNCMNIAWNINQEKPVQGLSLFVYQLFQPHEQSTHDVIVFFSPFLIKIGPVKT